MTDRCALAIDLGTTGLKVGIVSLRGKVLWTEDAELTTELVPDGGAEQDAERWWELIVGAARRGLASGVVAPEQVVAVTTTGQWASTVPVAADGTPVGPCILWMDHRGGRYVRKRIGGPVAGYDPRAIASWIRKTGGAPSTSGADPVGHLLHLLNDRPDIAAAARWFVEPVDYVSMRFTGEAHATHASMTAAWLTDNRHLDVLDYDADLLRRVGLDAAKLPPLRPTASPVGTVLDAVADDVGLPRGVVVIAGTPDLHSVAAGAGTLREYQTHMALSTTSWISCPVSFKKTDAIRQIATVPGVGPSGYLIADNHETAGACLQWLRDKVLSTEPASRPSFAALTELAAGAAPGAGGVVFTPWLAGSVPRSTTRAHGPGSTTCRWRPPRPTSCGRCSKASPTTRGGCTKPSSGSSSAASSPSASSGVARNPISGRRSTPTCSTARSSGWPTRSTSACGRRAAGRHRARRDRAEDPDTLVEVDVTFYPDPANRDVYDRLYRELPKLYKAQKPMFKRLNRRRR